jgi:hypothetical protein
MAISIDTSQALRRPADLRQLVEAVVAALPADEAEWVEWKGSLPLDAAEGWFSISKQILGFANRWPERAARFLGGNGYLIVGAQPGTTVAGVTPVDVAKLDDWLRAYLGEDGPVWAPTYVTVAGKHVLVVVVEAPRWGDRICVLRKSYQPIEKGQGAPKGTVFVRRQASTERATDAEMDMLQERLLRGQRQPSLELRLGWKDGPVALTPIRTAPEARRAWLDARRKVLLRSLQDHQDRPARAVSKLLKLGDVTGARGLADVSAAASFRKQDLFNLWGTASRKEDRTPEQYRAQVEEYLQKANPALHAATVDALARSGANTVRLALTNATNRNLPKVKLTLHVPGRVWAIDEDDLDDEASPELAQSPRRYGTFRPTARWPAGLSPIFTSPLSHSTVIMPRGTPFGLEIDNSGSARLTFHVGDLRPRDTAELDGFVLMVEEPGGGQSQRPGRRRAPASTACRRVPSISRWRSGRSLL